MIDDREWVARARGGDREAFAALVRRHGGLARAIARAVVGDAVDDVAQEAFLRAWTNLDLLVDPSRFSAWLGRIAFAVAIDERRRRRATVSIDRVTPPSDPAPLGDELVAARQLEHAVRAAIARLPPRYRRPLVLYHLGGLRHDRIAAALGVEASTVRSLVTRARRILRALLPGVEQQRDALADSPTADDLLADAQARHVLHVVNGDCTGEPLMRSGVPGHYVASADVLLEGPCLPVWGPPWWDARAAALSARGWVTVDEARRQLEAWDRALAEAPAYDEVILWYEHDVFDQLLLVRLLAHLAAHPPAPARLSLVSIGSHPAVPNFKGLGELTPDQLASLYETRATVDDAMLAQGSAAWRAITAPTPLDLVVDADAYPSLPWLARAMRRMLEELPAVGDGLTRTQRHVLALVGDGIVEPVRLWHALHDAEDCHYVSDLQLHDTLADLAAPPAPLVTLDGPLTPTPAQTPRLALTELARDVLAGRIDWLARAGIDRWLGGVHLTDPASCWRWDPVAGMPVRP